MRRIRAATAAAAMALAGMVVVGPAQAEETTTAAPAAVPTADALRDAVAGCDRELTSGRYAENAGGSATIPVCATGSAVHWKADFDVDCDGQRTAECNENTDPWFQPQTAFRQSDGKYLNSATLPHVVVPMASSRWDYRSAGITGGTVAAVVYQDTVVYAVVGDVGPAGAIGEGSYALAEALGINPDPHYGGISGKVVDFILFPGVTASPIEDHDDAVSEGGQAATAFLNGCGRYGFSSYPALETGDSGAEVSAAQCLLDDLGFPVDGGPTGEFDAATAAAVTGFQADRDLPQNGRIDSHTWTAMLSHGTTPLLREGSTGAAVVRLQRALTAALGEPLGQDGIFGPLTEQAVIDYQNSAGLDDDGIVGPLTWAALQRGD
ncbi:peptidoglycan hydrolase-like protein with peptidoglycan-binding domain [Stackebrandtia albiflava]|uniref:Peptidoglycan hydrolase-like protein with peptidoglycan-binding domain n=1 Tax=Stackebrandtia albiflava TaxID=406432 RepID=A0A562VAU5_9ACTN|nr:peptidoglycan-binding protein [Stackebrandtia albiflava]TWJ14984.1 peptidoglycan hydrolase-like protein with peptidoglycan-binding domain [Stackebrandtia albiflava]